MSLTSKAMFAVIILTVFSGVVSDISVPIYNGTFITNGTNITLASNNLIHVFPNIHYATAGQFEYPKVCRGGPHCLQNPKELNLKCIQITPRLQLEGVPNCLVLTVRTPDISGNRPVIVYIHGGGLMYGFGGNPTDFSNFAYATDSVVVSFNYRLGLLGFLSSPSLRDDKLGTFGNYGHADQVAALEWVSENIHHYGGNASNVTLLGFSAGASSALAMMVSPLADGLFHNIVALGPALRWTVTNAEAASLTENVGPIHALKCLSAENVASCLKSRNPYVVTKSLFVNPYRGFGYFKFPKQSKQATDDVFFTVVDGKIVERAPADYENISFKPSNRIKVFIGSNAQECNEGPTGSNFQTFRIQLIANLMLLGNNTKFAHFDANDVEKFADEIINEYNVVANKTEGYYEKIIHSISTDIRNTCPTNNLAQILSQNPNLDVYRIHGYYRNETVQFEHGGIFRLGTGFMEHNVIPDSPVIKNGFTNLMSDIAHGHFNGTGKSFPTKTLYFSDRYVGYRDEQPQKSLCDFWKSKGMDTKYGWENKI